MTSILRENNNQSSKYSLINSYTRHSKLFSNPATYISNSNTKYTHNLHVVPPYLFIVTVQKETARHDFATSSDSKICGFPVYTLSDSFQIYFFPLCFKKFRNFRWGLPCDPYSKNFVHFVDGQPNYRKFRNFLKYRNFRNFRNFGWAFLATLGITFIDFVVALAKYSKFRSFRKFRNFRNFRDLKVSLEC